MLQETLLTLSRMSCSGCVKNITRILSSLPTTEVVATDLSTKTVHLRYDTEQLTVETIKTALSDAKYPVANEQAMIHSKGHSF